MPPFKPVHAAAFAEGRRLREASRTRRRMRRGRKRTAHRPPPPLMVLGILFLAAAASAAMVALFTLAVAGAFIVVNAAPVLIVAALIATHGRRHTALRRGGAPGTAPIPARPAARPDPKAVWRRARDRFHALRGEYAAFECDAMQVLRLPALADVSVPSTARFVDAFAEAQALETDAYPPREHATSFVSAVDRAERSWKAAREAADRIRLSGLSPAERSTVERVIKLLTTARDSDSDPERLAAYSRARLELGKLDRAGVIHMPRPAEVALDAAARGALPA
ncbi:hypothetical protein GCM10009609_42720 [Pseudonocardia aurantiaca]|uniref:DUF2786 domain-containing protein n=1 Tax=Pseudonocardia aurantiaca TaxID=75290 RepID=A0ABW4FYG5_9PSEU